MGLRRERMMASLGCGPRRRVVSARCAGWEGGWGVWRAADRVSNSEARRKRIIRRWWGALETPERALEDLQRRTVVQGVGGVLGESWSSSMTVVSKIVCVGGPPSTWRKAKEIAEAVVEAVFYR